MSSLWCARFLRRGCPLGVPEVDEDADSDALADDLAALISALRRAPTLGRVRPGGSGAWALAHAMGLVHYYATTKPAMHRLRVRTLEQALA